MGQVKHVWWLTLTWNSTHSSPSALQTSPEGTEVSSIRDPSKFFMIILFHVSFQRLNIWFLSFQSVRHLQGVPMINPTTSLFFFCLPQTVFWLFNHLLSSPQFPFFKIPFLFLICSYFVPVTHFLPSFLPSFFPPSSYILVLSSPSLPPSLPTLTSCPWRTLLPFCLVSSGSPPTRTGSVPWLSPLWQVCQVCVCAARW